MRVRAELALALAQLAFALAAPASAGCASDLDCSLSGACNVTSGACACDAGWTGADCAALDLLPAKQASGLHVENVSSWGASVLPFADAGGETEMFASMLVNCGLTSWQRNCYIARATSAGLDEPFAPVGTAIPLWSTNVVALNATGFDVGAAASRGGEAYLIFHVGDGTQDNATLQACTPEGDGGADLGPAAAPAANGTSQCGLLWFPCAPPPTCDEMPSLDGFECVTYACGGDDAWRYAAPRTGAPALGNSGAALGDNVDCGARLKDVMLACDGAVQCAAEAAEACAATAGCSAFAVSSDLDNYTFAMLFATGRAGLRPNAQWNTWVRKGDLGAPPGPPQALPPRPRLGAPASADALSFPVSFASSILGPWTTVYANTTSPTNGNNPAPFLAHNGSVFVVFNDGHMSLFRSDAGFRGPYSLVTQGTCGGGEDPVIWLGARGWHCLYHRTPFADPNHQAIGHAFSADGFAWRQSPSAAATSVVAYEDGAGGVLNVTFGKRERPHLLFDPASGEPVAFVSAVGINPSCDPFVFTAGVPAIDAARLAAIAADTMCDPWVQYQRLDLNPAPAFYDRSWTHVQRLRRGAR
jgi:hypothetical protein